jgi:membrane-bound hydrogenase subunit mbhJ
MFFTRWVGGLLRRHTTFFPQRPDGDVLPPGQAAPQLLRGLPPGALRTSLAIRHIDVGSCGGPESEIGLLSAPPYDISRFGFVFTPSPRHADLLLVTGSLTPEMEPVLRETYAAMPEPRRVVALGACAGAGCPLARAPEAVARLQEVVPVDVFVPGCPPPPAAIIAGLFAAVGRTAPALPRPEAVAGPGAGGVTA